MEILSKSTQSDSQPQHTHSATYVCSKSHFLNGSAWLELTSIRICVTTPCRPIFPVFKQKTKESALPVPGGTKIEVAESLDHFHQELDSHSKALD